MLIKKSKQGINRMRLIVFAVVAAAHAVLILFLAVNIHPTPIRPQVYEPVLVMRLTDFDEIIPLPPVPLPPPVVSVADDVPVVEAIAEIMIEVQVLPEQIIAAPGTLVAPAIVPAPVSPWAEFLPAHRLTTAPSFDERAIAAALVFPPLALRSGIEGRVMLELFVDRNGVIQHVRLLREEPEGNGFGEAALRVFTGRQGTPATLDGIPVASRFRYPISFRIR